MSYEQNPLPQFNNQPNTLAPAPRWHRIEGFVSGFLPHNQGNGGILFLQETRTKSNSQQKTYHTASINLFNEDAAFISAVSDFLKSNDSNWVYISVEVRWQSYKQGTGQFNGEHEKTRDVMSYEGREVIEVNPSQQVNAQGEAPRAIRNTAKAWFAQQNQQNQ